MSGMWPRAVRSLSEPRRLMAVAAVLAAFGLVAGYIEAQGHADRTLALRQGPPPAVAVEAFRPRRDTGPAGEVAVYAELDPGRGRVLSRPEADPPARVWIAPLFPLSDLGSAALKSGGDTVSAQVARRAPVGAAPVAPAGYVVWPLGPDAAPPDRVAARVFGQGSHGQVVMLNGEVAGDETLLPLVADAFAQMGLAAPAAPVAIAPYAHGREAALARPGGEGYNRWLFHAALVFGLLAVVRMVWQPFDGRRVPASAKPAPGDDGTPPAAHPSFAPLPSQADLTRAEAAEEEAAHPSLRDRFLDALARLRNRR